MVDAQQEEEYREMWDNWLIFQTYETTNDQVQIRKQIGVINDKQEFTVRPSLIHPPNLQEIYEAILNGVIKRKELGLYQNQFIFYNELQLALNEFIKMFTPRKEIIIDTFQNLTSLSLTKESMPKIVIRCSNCNSYVYYTNTCSKCRNAFYCDQSCVKADLALHSKACVQTLQLTPRLFAPLIVEMHSGSDLKQDVNLYYEHEMKFSQKLRGMQLFTHLKKFMLKHRWLKGNKYTIEEHEQSMLKFVKHEDHEDMFALKRDAGNGLIEEVKSESSGDDDETKKVSSNRTTERTRSKPREKRASVVLEQ